MPAVVGSSILAGLGALATGGSFFAAFGLSMLLGGISYALTPRPKRGNAAPGTVAVRQSDLTRTIVYGHTRVVRGFAHMESTDDNSNLHMIIILCEGHIRAINEVWVNDKSVAHDWLDANGNVTHDWYRGKMTIRKHYGSPSQAADSLAVSNMRDWTADHRLQGIAYLYVILKQDRNIYVNGVPNFSAIVEGRSVYDPRVNGNRWTTNTALLVYDFIKNPVYGYGAQDDDVDEVNIAAQANICDEMVSVTPQPYTITAVQTNIDMITLEGSVLGLQYGDRVRLTTTGTLPAPLLVDTDYYVIPFQVNTYPRLQLATTFDNAMARNVINITTQGTGTSVMTKIAEPRYHASGLIDTGEILNKSLNDLVNAMAGRAVNVGGKWSILAGAWRSPALTFGIGDMRGSGFTFQNCLSMSESYNQIKGIFTSPVSFYQPTDYPAAFFQQFLEEDGGFLQPRELNLPFVMRSNQAQRIAKIELFRGRQDIAVQCSFSTKALQTQPGDVIGLTLERFGWNNKAFEITTFSLDSSDNALLINMNLRETSSQIYEWSENEELEFLPSPDVNLPDPYLVEAPTGVGYNSRTFSTESGDTLFTLQLQWDEHDNAFVRDSGDFEIQYKLSSSTEWLPSFFVDGSLTKTDITTASPNVSYDVRIRARNNFGARSAWVTIYNAIVGSSGGVGTSIDWETFSDPVTITEDWGSVSSPVTITEDWGYF